MCTGGNLSGYIPTHTSPTSSLIPGNLWRSVSSWMPQRETASSQNSQSTRDGRFPGSGRTLGAGVNQSSGAASTESSLQARLLDNSSPDRLSETTTTGTGQLSSTRPSTLDNAVTEGNKQITASSGSSDAFALIIDGKSLAYALEDDVKSLFLGLAVVTLHTVNAGSLRSGTYYLETKD